MSLFDQFRKKLKEKSLTKCFESILELDIETKDPKPLHELPNNELFRNFGKNGRKNLEDMQKWEEIEQQQDFEEEKKEPKIMLIDNSFYQKFKDKDKISSKLKPNMLFSNPRDWYLEEMQTETDKKSEFQKVQIKNGRLPHKLIYKITS